LPPVGAAELEIELFQCLMKMILNTMIREATQSASLFYYRAGL